MPENYSVFKIPSYARKEAYDFVESQEKLNVFEELNQIAEEIEKCRAENG